MQGSWADTLVLLPALQKWQFAGAEAHDWSFCKLCPEFAPTAHAHSYFQPLIVSLYFVA